MTFPYVPTSCVPALVKTAGRYLASAAAVVALVGVFSCARGFAFLDAYGRDIADTVLACVPLGEQVDSQQAAECFDAARGGLESAGADPMQGKTVLDCADALREAERARAAGAPSEALDAEAAELVESLR